MALRKINSFATDLQPSPAEGRGEIETFNTVLLRAKQKAPVREALVLERKSGDADEPSNEPLTDEMVEELGQSEPGVLPVGDTRTAEEIIADTPALANLREVHKQLLRRMIPGYETDPAAAYHAAAVIRHIKNYDGNGNWVKDRAKAENGEIYGFKSAESIYTHKNTEARRFEDFIRYGYATLKGEEKIAPFMPFSETRTAEEIIADSPFLSSLAPGETQDMLDEIVPGYRTDARAAWHADRVMRMLERYDSNGTPFRGDDIDDHRTRRLEEFLNMRYDAIHGGEEHYGLEIDQSEFDASTERREDIRSRLTEEARVAAENFDKERYDALVAAGADAEAVPYQDPREALGAAVRSGDTDAVQRLLDTGKVDINAVDDQGRTVLFEVVDTPVDVINQTNPKAMLQVLLAKGIDMTKLDNDGVSALEALRDAAIIRGPYQIGDATQTRAAALHDAANDLQSWLTADLRTAVAEADQARAVALIKAGADGGAGFYGEEDRTKDISILQFVIGAGQREAFDAILASKPEGALKELINEQWEEGNTAAHAAAIFNQPEMLEELRRLGVDETIRNDAGMTPEEAFTHFKSHLERRGLPAAIVGAANLLEYLGLAGPAGLAIAAGAGAALLAYALYQHIHDGDASVNRPVPSPREGEPFSTPTPVQTSPTLPPQTSPYEGSPTVSWTPTFDATPTPSSEGEAQPTHGPAMELPVEIQEMIAGNLEGDDLVAMERDLTAYADTHPLFRAILRSGASELSRNYLALVDARQAAHILWLAPVTEDSLELEAIRPLTATLAYVTAEQREQFVNAVLRAGEGHGADEEQQRFENILELGPGIGALSDQQINRIVDAIMGVGDPRLHLNPNHNRRHAVESLIPLWQELPAAAQTRLFNYVMTRTNPRRQAGLIHAFGPVLQYMDTAPGGMRARLLEAAANINDPIQAANAFRLGEGFAHLTDAEEAMLADAAYDRFLDASQLPREDVQLFYVEVLSRLFHHLDARQRDTWRQMLQRLQMVQQPGDNGPVDLVSPTLSTILALNTAEEDDRDDALTDLINLPDAAIVDYFDSFHGRQIRTFSPEQQERLVERLLSVHADGDRLLGIIGLTRSGFAWMDSALQIRVLEAVRQIPISAETADTEQAGIEEDVWRFLRSLQPFMESMNSERLRLVQQIIGNVPEQFRDLWAEMLAFFHQEVGGRLLKPV
jgi:ankyrin repeat protein